MPRRVPLVIGRGLAQIQPRKIGGIKFPRTPFSDDFSILERQKNPNPIL